MIADLPSERSRPAGTTLASRYGQLLYTSWDDGSGSGGGWQIKEEVGDLSKTERAELTSRVATRFDAGRALPPYPTPDDIAARPARLNYAGLSGTAAGYWHTVDAGKDATGRPGNVAAHVVIDRQTDEPSPVRPIQLWGAPQWLRPYGPVEVAAATVADFPAPDGRISVASAVHFLTGSGVDRQPVLRVLLDAVADALAGGKPVVLAVDELDNGPRWIAAVSFFMSPGTARRLWWSTYDDPGLAVSEVRRGVHLVVVNRSRLAEMSLRSCVVVDETVQPDSSGVLGEMHAVAGSSIPVSAWSILTEGVLGDEDIAAHLLAEQDRVAAAVGDVGLSPAWPLAVAVRREPSTAEYHADADLVIVDEAPARPITVDWIAAVVAQSTAATAPADAAEAARRLAKAVERSYGVEGAAERLVRMALAEPAWLLGDDVGSIPTLAVIDAAAVQPAVEQLLASCGGTAAHTVGLGVRAAELLSRLGIRDAGLDAVWGAVASTLAGPIIGLLQDPHAVSVLTNDSTVGADVREAVIRPAVASASPDVLDTVGISAWRWLFGDDIDATPTLAPNPRPTDVALFPRYTAAALDDSARHGAWSERQISQLAVEAIYLALGDEELPDEQCRVLISRLTRHTRLPANDLYRMLTRWPERIAASEGASCLYFEAAPTELVELIAARGPAGADLTTAWDGPTIAAARLRALPRAPLPFSDHQLAEAKRCVPLVLSNVPLDYVAVLADDLADAVAVLVVATRSRGEDFGELAGVADAVVKHRLGGVRGSSAVALLLDVSQTGAIDIDWLFGHVLFQRVAAAVPGLSADAAGQDWADGVVDNLTSRGVNRGPTTTAEFRDACWPYVRVLSAEAAEAFFAGYGTVAEQWLSEHTTADFDKQRLGFRRFS